MSGERYQGYANWDTWNTILILDNTEVSQRWLHNWHQNWKNKITKGNFDREKARLVVKKYIVPTARGKGQHAKMFMQQGFTPDSDINPNKVDADEVIDHILNMEDEGDKLKEIIRNPPISSKPTIVKSHKRRRR